MCRVYPVEILHIFYMHSVPRVQQGKSEITVHLWPMDTNSQEYAALCKEPMHMEEEREYCEVFMTLEEHDVAQDYGDSRMKEYSGSKFGGKQSPNSEVECIIHSRPPACVTK